MSEIPAQEAEQGDCHELEAKLRQANLLEKNKAATTNDCI